MFDDAELRADLGATDDGGQGLFGVGQHLVQGIDFTGEQRAEGFVFREKLRNDGGRGVGAVGRAEGIVDVDVAVLGELAREELVAALLFRMEAEVFQQRDFTGLQGLGDVQRGVFHAVGGKLDGPTKQRLEPGQDVLQAEFLIAAFGAAEVGHEYGRTALLQDVLDGGKCCADARVIGYFSGFVQRDVEVHADQGALALEVEVGEVHASANNWASPTFSSTRAAKSAMATRSWAMVSRSRMVTALSVRES